MKKTPLKRKTALKQGGRLNPISKRRAGQLKGYRILRKCFLKMPKNRWCPVMLKIHGQYVPATEIHHKKGREGDMLLDVEFWMAVSRQGHNFVHANQTRARSYGWLLRK